MNENTVAKIQEVILAKPEVHTQLVAALRTLLNEVGEVFTAEELFAALKSQVKGGNLEAKCGTTYENFWGNY